MEQNANVQPARKTSKGETISELAHRHLMDANHVTTDEELRNVQLDPFPEHIDEIVTNEEAGEGGTDNRLLNNDDVVTTPWQAIK